MPPRVSLSAVLRQTSNLFKIQTAPLSTTASKAIRRDVSSASSLLNLGSDSGNGKQANGNDQQDMTNIYNFVTNSGKKDGQGSERQQSVADDLRNKNRTDDYSKQLPRRWAAGEVYAPHDLSPSEAERWKKPRARRQDLVDILGVRPLDLYRNFSVLQEYMTPHGKIRHSNHTGLKARNQRKMAKAIRRAIGLGLHPSVHYHPEILLRQKQHSIPTSDSSISNRLMAGGRRGSQPPFKM